MAVVLRQQLPVGARVVAAVAGVAAIGGALHLLRSFAGLDLALALLAGATAGLVVAALARLSPGWLRVAGAAAATSALLGAAFVEHAEAQRADEEYRAQVAVAGVVSSRPPLPGPAVFMARRLGLAPGPERLAGLGEFLGACAAGALAAASSHRR